MAQRFAAYDLVVVGAGPAGYPAAIRAAQRGLKVASVEKASLGGTCLNVGCIPSKTLLNASLKFHEGKKHFKDLGIKGGNKLQVDMPAMLKKKNTVIKQLVGGIGFLFKKNKVTPIQGEGTFSSDGRFIVTKPDGSVMDDIDTNSVVLALGSTPSFFPGMELDGKNVISSTEALELKKVPKKMIVIGAGVIGLEIGTLYNRLGASVEVIEFLPRICPSLDKATAASFQKILNKQGLKLNLETKVISARTVGDGVEVVVADKQGKETVMEGDVCLVAVGRKPSTNGLGLENVGVALDKMGRIPTVGGDSFAVKTSKGANFKQLYAIGDCISGPMLAHKAEEDGIALADHLAGGSSHIPDYNHCPQVIYTEPEVGGVGETEEQLQARGCAFKAASFSNAANSRSKCIGSEGEVKILYDPESLRVLGAWVIGSGAGELIHQLSTLMHNDRTLRDISSQTFAHPTLSEAVKEAAMIAVDGFAIHC